MGFAVRGWTLLLPTLLLKLRSRGMEAAPGTLTFLCIPTYPGDRMKSTHDVLMYLYRRCMHTSVGGLAHGRTSLKGRQPSANEPLVANAGLGLARCPCCLRVSATSAALHASHLRASLDRLVRLNSAHTSGLVKHLCFGQAKSDALSLGVGPKARPS